MAEETLSKLDQANQKILKELHGLAGRNLEQVEKIDWSTRGYTVTKTGTIGGLGLFHCDIDPLRLQALVKILPGLTNLNLSGNNLTDTSALAGLKNLMHLDLRGNQLSDISVLCQLPNLTQLNLCSNHLEDISVLKDLHNLTQLSLSDNNLSDISVLVDIPNLIQLDLSGNPLLDISVLKKLLNLTTLDLSRNQLDDISVLESLANLTWLNLGDNKLSDVSVLNKLPHLTYLVLNDNSQVNISALRGLVSLRRLDIRGNGLTDISVLRELENLIRLDLSENQLTDISVLRELPNITQLDLSENQLKDISVLKELPNLTTLDLSYNHVGGVFVLSKLLNLKTLDLSCNQLTDVSMLAGLSNLRELNLRGNRLADVAVLKDLTNLTKLDLRINSLADITFLQQISKIRQLYLGGNQISNVSVLKGLTKLTDLDLSRNQLSDVAPLKGLVNLTTLDLSKNRLKNLPPEFFYRDWEVHFDNEMFFEGLNLMNNPLESPPANVIKQGKEFVHDYFESRDIGVVHLNEAKVVFVGQEGVGKTSLINILTGQSFNHDQAPTDGIDITKCNMDVNGKKTRLNMWDFGGRDQIQAAHQFFLTKQNLYILVVDAGLNESENMLEYWLKIIETFGGNSSVIVVRNKCEQMLLDVPDEKLKKIYPSVNAVVSTSCTKSEGIDTLMEAMVKELSRLPYMSAPVPAAWKKIKTELEKLKFSQIDFATYQALCNEHEIVEAQEQLELIEFLHNLGIVLNFHNDKPIEETVIFDPAWLTGGVYNILGSEKISSGDGSFCMDDLSEILPAQQYPQNTPELVVDILNQFELCFEFDQGRYLIPDFLPKQEIDTGNWGSASRLIYSYHVLPMSVMSRFIARMHDHIKDNTIWRTGVLLETEDAHGLVKINTKTNNLSIFLRGLDNGRKELLELIESQLAGVHSSFGELEYTKKITIPSHPNIAVDYSHLQNLIKMEIDKFVPEGLQEAYNPLNLLGTPPGKRMSIYQKTLSIRQIEIENICCFETLSLDLTGSDMAVLLGDNGAGKTTLLRLIAIGLCDANDAADMIRSQYRNIIRDKSKAAVIKLEVGYKGKNHSAGSIETVIRHVEESNDVEVVRNTSDDINPQDIFLCGYGVARSVCGSLEYDGYHLPEAICTLFDYRRSLQNPAAAMAWLENQELSYAEWLKKIDETLMLEHGAVSYNSENGIRVSGRWGQDYPLEYLPDGYHFTAAMLFDMLSWSAFYYKNDFSDEISGIVLIDEVEKNLHPKWQCEIVSLLHEQFPEIQFILTSQSPICAADMDEKTGRNILLKINDGYSESTADPQEVSNWCCDHLPSLRLSADEADSEKPAESDTSEPTQDATPTSEPADTTDIDLDFSSLTTDVLNDPSRADAPTAGDTANSAQAQTSDENSNQGNLDIEKLVRRAAAVYQDDQEQLITSSPQTGDTDDEMAQLLDDFTS